VAIQINQQIFGIHQQEYLTYQLIKNNMQGNLKQALEYASKNPTSDFAKQLAQTIKSGQVDSQAQQLGIDLTPIKNSSLGGVVEQPKKTFMEKVASFTGGEKIAQGIGQAIANPQIAKQQEQSLNDALAQQSQLLKRRKEIQDLGGDLSHIDKALEYNKQNLTEISQGMEGLLNQKGLTTKQVLGDALQLETTIAGVGTLPGGNIAKFSGALGKVPGLTKAIPTIASDLTKGAGIVKGAIHGAKTGAIAGGAYGLSSGVSGALKEDKSLGAVASAGLTGGITGAVTGGALGGVIGGVSGGIKQNAINKLTKEDDFALDLVSPKATDKVKQQALREGRVTEQGLLSASKITPSKQDIRVAESVKGIVSSKNSPIQNIKAIDDTIGELNTGLKAYVAENKVPFNTNQLRTQLNKGKDELKLIFASDKNAEKTYNAVVNEFISLVKNKDTKGLMDARQAFDKIPSIKKLLDSQGLAENVKKEVVHTARDKANQYVASLLPKGNKYREVLFRESRMIEAIENMTEKFSGNVGMNNLQILAKKYPMLKGVLGKLGIGFGLGAVGVGGAIIGSTD
jgi:hypothetical protein